MSDRRPAPVAVFAYRRKRHLEETLAALSRCHGYAEAKIFVFSDGPRSEAAATDVGAVRAILRQRAGGNLVVIEAETNRGLAASIIAGVSALCNEYGKVIVVEDDLILQPSSLLWFNECLEHYANAPEVYHIGAYQYRIPEFDTRRVGSFQRFTSSWGWATWERAWRNFDSKATGWSQLDSDLALEREFNCGGSYPFSDMLRAQMAGKIDSWAIRWWWTVFRSGGLSVVPPRSLVRNVGFDETATHNSVGRFKRLLSGPEPLLWSGDEAPGLPLTPTIDVRDERAFRRGLRRTNAMRNAHIKRVLSRMGLKRFNV